MKVKDIIEKYKTYEIKMRSILGEIEVDDALVILQDYVTFVNTIREVKEVRS